MIGRIILISGAVVIFWESIFLSANSRENRPKPNTICVANHTTPVDFAVLASDNTYAVVRGAFLHVSPWVFESRDNLLCRKLSLFSIMGIKWSMLTCCLR